MRVAWFDPFSGASGDMVLGTLIDAGLPIEQLRTELAKIDLDGYRISAERTTDRVIAGTRCRVELTGADAGHRHWSDIRALIEDSRLDAAVRASALAIFRSLAEAEAEIHGEPVDHVHFHEVGGVDAIVDICGACIGLDLLGIEAVFSGPPRVGHGMVQTQHGLLPIPAPATLLLMARAEAPIAAPRRDMESVEAELLTPTGAAILATLATFRRPDMVPTAIGYGYGTKELPWPNTLRVVIGEMADSEAANDGEADILIETNIDDMNPQFYEILVERLLAGGAYDVWLTPVQMKKGRPGTIVSVIASLVLADALEAVIFANTPTLGVRRTTITRTKAAREVVTVTTQWGEVRLKLRGLDGRVANAVPEYEDVVSISRRADIPVAVAWSETHRLGEQFLGRPWA
jgi:uncharacterized protein (TIGR00299 family) protein